ncbi:MAG: hypothetical protein R2809_14660 [Flavobacteriales bacterium]
MNGEPIEGANSLEYEATETGNYTVSFSYADGCVGEETSEEVSMVIQSVRENQLSSLNIYPEPIKWKYHYRSERVGYCKCLFLNRSFGISMET